MTNMTLVYIGLAMIIAGFVLIALVFRALM